jgi:hypothetical protein
LSVFSNDHSALFLHREYIPFLPTTESEPAGPVDPPLLEASAPNGWWQDGARELFDAAACITNILSELDDAGATLMTPFAGFCAFSAATMNLYVSRFPKLNLGRSSDATALAKTNKLYMLRFKSLWKMGEGWVCSQDRARTSLTSPLV